MNRRDFIKFVALTAAGTSALPQQLAALERYYEINSPQVEGLISVDEVIISGMADHPSIILQCDFFSNNNNVLNFGLNACGAVLRWIAAPNQQIVTNKFRWEIKDVGDLENQNIPIYGHINYIDQQGIRHSQKLSTRGVIDAWTDRHRGR